MRRRKGSISRGEGGRKSLDTDRRTSGSSLAREGASLPGKASGGKRMASRGHMPAPAVSPLEALLARSQELYKPLHREHLFFELSIVANATFHLFIQNFNIYRTVRPRARSLSVSLSLSVCMCSVCVGERGGTERDTHTKTEREAKRERLRKTERRGDFR